MGNESDGVTKKLQSCSTVLISMLQLPNIEMRPSALHIAKLNPSLGLIVLGLFFPPYSSISKWLVRSRLEKLWFSLGEVIGDQS